jgi:hypothetical protein
MRIALLALALCAPRVGSAQEVLAYFPTLGIAEINAGGVENVAPVPRSPGEIVVVPRMEGPHNYVGDSPEHSSGAALPAVAEAPLPSAPPLLSNFQGITNTGFYPPDPIMAAGPSDLVAMVNGGVALFTKAGVNSAQKSLNSFYNGTLSGSFAFDPKILFDPHTNRFFTVALDGQASPNSWLRITVSKSSSPTNLDVGVAGTDDWWGYNIDADLDGGVQVNNNWADYPGLGVDQYNLYITANMFSNAGASQYAKVWIIPKAALISGGAITVFEFGAPPGAVLSNPVTGFGDFTIMPAINHDLTNEHMLATNALGGGGTQGYVTFWTVNTPATTPSLSAVNLLVAGWNGFSMPDCAQLGGGTPIDTGDTRMLHVVERNGSIWATHTQPNANVGATRTEARWYEINPAGPSVAQFGQVSDPTRCYFFPAVQPSGAGDTCMVMSGVDATIYGSIFYTGRAATDPAGTMQSVATLQLGQNNYVLLDSLGRNRWGDYGGIADDPATGDTWMFHEYATASANVWATWFGRKLFGTPGPSPTPTDIPDTPTSTPTSSSTSTPTEAPTSTPTSTPTDTPVPLACGATPAAGCAMPQKSILLLKDKNGDGPGSSDKLIWKWLKGTIATPTEFGDPTSSAQYALCVYDADASPLALQAQVAAGGNCDGKDCWKALSKGFKFNDKPPALQGGVAKILLKANGGGKSKILVKGEDGDLGFAMQSPLLDASSTVSVRLINSDNSNCWGADFAPGEVTKNSGELFKAKTP